MRERTSNAEALRAGTPVTVGPVTLLPIERVVLQADGGQKGAWFRASKEPCALIVRDAAGIRALDTGAAVLPLAVLRERVAGLDAMLAALVQTGPPANADHRAGG